MRRTDAMLPAFLVVASCALLGGPAAAVAADPPEAPITEACSAPSDGFRQPLCGTLNPGSSANVGYYFEVREGSSCSGPPLGGTHFDGPSEVEGQGVAVSIEVNGFAPDTEYTYCLVATNASGETSGQGVTFVTSPAPPPSLSIDSESVSNVTSTDATLEAQIDTHGLETAYKLQIDTTGNFKFFQTDGCALHLPEMGCILSVVSGDPLPLGLVEPLEALLPAGAGIQHVSVNLATIGATLQPETTYHYRAMALNRTGYVYGPDQTFTTLSTDSPDSPDATPPGQPTVGSAALASPPAVNPAPPVSHPRRAKHKRHGHRRHNGSARSTRSVRR